MSELKNPSEIAREALKRLAARQLAPTPANYQACYNEIANLPNVAPFPEPSLRQLAAALVAIALLVCLRAGLYFSPVSHGALQWGISAIAVLMFARAIGDSELVGFFKKVGGSRFARLDTYFYSPLCLVLGAGLLVVAWS